MLLIPDGRTVELGLCEDAATEAEPILPVADVEG